MKSKAKNDSELSTFLISFFISGDFFSSTALFEQVSAGGFYTRTRPAKAESFNIYSWFSMNEIKFALKKIIVILDRTFLFYVSLILEL